MSRPRRYWLHGLSLLSEVELCAATDDETTTPDYTICWGDSVDVGDDPADGVVVARFTFPGGSGFVHVRTPAGYILRFPALCEFRVDDVQRSITVSAAPGINPEIVPLLFAGNVAAFLLNLAGDCVLHASAVDIDGGALAFVGQPGSGKSTLAALFCTAGAKLITDDVLRLEFDGTGCRCFLGTLELRLRSSASEIIRQFPAAAQRPTVDERTAIRPDAFAASCKDRPSLRAILIPRLTRAAAAVRIERLSPPEALFGLLGCPSMFGWQADEPIVQQFHALGRAAGGVPTYDVTIPWGQPDSLDLPDTLLRGLD